MKLTIDKKHITLDEITNASNVKISENEEFITFINHTHDFMMDTIKQGNQSMVLLLVMVIVGKIMLHMKMLQNYKQICLDFMDVELELISLMKFVDTQSFVEQYH